MGTKFRGIKISRFCWNIFIIKIFIGFNFRGFIMGVITMPFSDYCCAMVLVDQWTIDGEGKQHMEFLFSGQWLDKSNEGVPFSSLSCPATARSCVGVASQKFRWDYFFAVWLVPSKTVKFNHPWKFVPIRYIDWSRHFEIGSSLHNYGLRYCEPIISTQPNA